MERTCWASPRQIGRPKLSRAATPTIAIGNSSDGAGLISAALLSVPARGLFHRGGGRGLLPRRARGGC